MPTTVIADAVGMGILDVMVSAGLAASKGEARRLVQQGGVSVNDQKVTDATATLSEADFAEGAAIIKKGKKVYHKITLA
jgi:tyrosyl-tRNA synthetase